MKTIVTHYSPDLDAITSVWLIKKYLPGWKEAEVKFVSAGETLNNEPVDRKENIIHVDTGLGRFDHHQSNDNTCAAMLVFNFLKKKNLIKKTDIESLERLINFVNLIDHFGEVNFQNPDDDVYDFCLHQIIEGSKLFFKNDSWILDHHLKNLDSILIVLKNKLRAEVEIKRGFIFDSYVGKGIAFFSNNEETLKLALKKGFHLAIRKDKNKGYIRIKSLPLSTIDLTPIYQQIKKIDKKGYWYLHPSKNIIINGSSKNPNAIPTSVTLNQIIELIRKL